MMHSIESEIANWVDHAIFKNVSRPTQRAPDPRKSTGAMVVGVGACSGRLCSLKWIPIK